MSYPFRESAKSSSSRQQIPPSAINEAYKGLVAAGRQSASFQCPTDQITQFFEVLSSAITDHIKAANELTTPSIIRLPPLYPDFVAAFVNSNPSVPRPEIGGVEQVVAIFCAIFAEISEIPIRRINFGDTSLWAAIQTELASYLAWKSLHEARSIADVDLESAVNKFARSAQKLTAEVQDVVMSANTRLIELQSKDMELRTSIERSKTDAVAEAKQLSGQVNAAKTVLLQLSKQTEEIEAALEKTDNNIKSFGTAVREELKIDNTKRLWQRRAWFSTISFWVSAGMIALALAYPPFLAYSHLDKVIETLRHIGDAATQGLPPDATAAQLTAATISRLVVITIPLALYLWGVKLLVRFNARSLMLMDDARQRGTMMDTYFHLIERDAATKEDRALILNALFRPAPGHGSDNVEPPNFTELLDKAMGKN